MMDDSYCEKHYKIRYSEFNGTSSEDVEHFLKDFDAVARYNEQDTDEEKLRIVPDLLKRRALTWYKSLPADDTQDWERFRAALVNQFRRNPHRLLTKLSRIKKNPEDSIRKYSIKVTKLINRLQTVDEPYPERLKVWWYLKGLPTSVRKYCLQGGYATLEDAISTAKTYEDTALTPRELLTGRAPQEKADSDAYSEFSDVESCTSGGTFISSVAESVDSRQKKIGQRKVYSSPGLTKEALPSRERKSGKCNDRPVTGVTRDAEKPSRKLKDQVGEKMIGEVLDSQSLSLRVDSDIERLTRRLQEPTLQRKYNLGDEASNSKPFHGAYRSAAPNPVLTFLQNQEKLRPSTSNNVT